MAFVLAYPLILVWRFLSILIVVKQHEEYDEYDTFPSLKEKKAIIRHIFREIFDLAQSIHNRLVAMGIDVFVDEEDIDNERFHTVIKSEIERRDYYFLILSSTENPSPFVIRELQIIQQLEKKIVVLLVRDDDTILDNKLVDYLEQSSYNKDIVSCLEQIEREGRMSTVIVDRENVQATIEAIREYLH